MIKYSGSEFGLLTTGTMKKRIVDNKNVDTFFIRKTFDLMIYDLGCQSRSKAKPVCFYRIHESIKGILRELHYIKRDVFMPFLLAEILNFQDSTHLIGVGSLSK